MGRHNERREQRQLEAGKLGERRLEHDRPGDLVRSRLVDDRLVLARIEALEALDEPRQARWVRLRQHADLPENEQRASIRSAPASEEVGRLVADAARVAGIEAEICEQ